MAQRKINPEYLSYYNKVTMIQPLARGYVLKQIFERVDNNIWKIQFKTTSPYPLCPLDGMQRTCKDCDGLNDEKKCLSHGKFINSNTACNRINDCIKAGLEIEYEE